MINKCINLRIRSNKGQAYYYCTRKRTVVDFKECSSCIYKEYKKTSKMAVKKPLNKISKTNKIVKSTAIPKAVKLKVWERDKHKCIFCQTPVSWNYANSHYIKRSHLGLGIEENIFTACPTCHHDFDDTPKRKFLLPLAKDYLMSKYNYWNEDILVYKKWGN